MYYTVSNNFLSEILSQWKHEARNLAETIIKGYVNPNEASMNTLTWYNIAPWRKTIITNRPQTIDYPIPHQGFIANTLAYPIPLERLKDVIEFNNNLLIDFLNHEMTSRSDDPALNILNFNFIHEILTNQIKVDEAKKLYENEFLAYKSGKLSSYTTKLNF